jgi:hypothetical protein
MIASNPIRPGLTVAVLMLKLKYDRLRASPGGSQ